MTPTDPRPETVRGDEDEDSERIDRGLAVAFDAPMAGHATILEQIAGCGEVRPVLLRDAERATSALVLPAGAGHRGRMGRYQILGEIARGGMGVVLKGRDADLGRELAVKVLHERHLGNSQVVARFVEEAQVGGQLQHPGIVPVHDIGVDDERRPYFTMRLVEGSTLARLLARRESPASERARFLAIFVQVCDAVGYAHARGVVHRDLKPSNVLVGQFGEVQVVDWGLAKVLPRGGVADEGALVRGQRDENVVATVRSGPDGMESQAGSVMGTPGYMPPEQARGLLAQVDERADVFALGAVLCEILTGAGPYGEGTAAETTERAKHADLADAHARLDRAGIDPSLAEIVHACLAEDPNARPQDASAVGKRVSEYLSSAEQRAREGVLAAARAEARANAERRARRMTLALAGTLVAALAVGASTYLWHTARVQEHAEIVEEDIHAALREASERVAEGHVSLAASSMQRARGLLITPGISDQVRESVAEISASIERSQQDARLTARLEEVRDSDEVSAAGVGDHYARVLAEEGIDIDAVSESELLQRVGGSASELARTVAFALDDSVWRRRPLVGEVPEAARRRVELAKAIDGDPWRNDLRSAALAGDAERLTQLAAGFEPADRPPASLVTLALSLAGVEKLDEAVDVLQAASRAYPGDFSVQLNLARLRSQRPNLVTERDVESVAVPARIARSLRPGSLGARSFLAVFLVEHGRGEEALMETEDALALGPENPRARLLRIRVLRRLGRSADALAGLGTIAGTDRDSVSLRWSRAALFLDTDDLPHARDAIREALDAAAEAAASGPDAAAQRAAPGAIRRRGPRNRDAQDFDTDEDGLVVAAELPPRLAPVFDLLDRDGDGELTGVETAPLRLLAESQR